MMRAIFLSATLILIGQISTAQTCNKQLKSLLLNAQQLVKNNFAAGTPCYRAAIIGRTQGRPGCFPPEAFELRDILKPIASEAAILCTTICRTEKLEDRCRTLVNQDNLKNWGIQKTLQAL